jgi:serine/threonine protein kinase
LLESSAQPRDARIVAQIGPYELLERIGIGGMAEVFKARHSGAQGFERMVAVKRILPNIAADPDFVRMFIDEAKIAVQLQHPNIAQIYDLGRDGGELFIALEYIEGRDMKAVAKRQKTMGRHLPLSFVVYTVVKICEALQHAHFARGSTGEPLRFIHRDISPQNILVSHEGAVKVIDFGLAKAQGRLVTTQAGVVKGKLAYLSAEQARGESIDYRSDIFSLGTCFYEWLTGERLFLRNNDADTVVAVQRAMVPPLRAVRPELPMQLQMIVRRALEADPALRYQSAAEMQEALMSFAVDAGMPVRRRSASKHMLLLFPEDQKGNNGAVPSRRETIRSVETKLPRNAEARDLVSAVPQSVVPHASVSQQAIPTRASGRSASSEPNAAAPTFSDVSAVEELSIMDLIDPEVAGIPFDDEVSAVPIVEHDSTALPLGGSASTWDDVTRSFGGGSKSSDFDALDAGPPTARGAKLAEAPVAPAAEFQQAAFQAAAPAAAAQEWISDATTGNLRVRAETLATEAGLGDEKADPFGDFGAFDEFDDSTKMYSTGAVGEYLRQMESLPDAEPLTAEVTRSGSESEAVLASFQDPSIQDASIEDASIEDASIEDVQMEDAEEFVFSDESVAPSSITPPNRVALVAEFVDETAEESLALAEFDDITYISALPDLDDDESEEPEENTQPSIDVPTFLREEES